MLKKVELYTDLNDPGCSDVNEFLKGLEIILKIHDVKKDPLKKEEIAELLRHFSLEHFINRDSDAYKKFRLDKGVPSRDEVYEMMAEDNDLLRRPIIVAGRLMTVGCNIDKVKEMLQISANGSGNENDDSAYNRKDSNRGRRR
jgi:regulatory protein spx